MYYLLLLVKNYIERKKNSVCVDFSRGTFENVGVYIHSNNNKPF